MKEIPLTQDKITKIDDIFYDFLIQRKWHAQKDKNTWYATRSESKKEYELEGRTQKTRKTTLMHRLIMEHYLGRKLEPWEEIDHIDGNGLNNQIDNLRIGTHQQNTFNQKSNRGISKYKGVSWSNILEKWQTSIGVGETRKHLGYFDDEILAAVAYNKAALKYHGEFAKLNEGPELEKYSFDDIDKLRYKGNGSSKYKGVSWKESNHKWRAFIYINGKHVHLGYFTEEEEAALAYNNYVLGNGLNKNLNILER